MKTDLKWLQEASGSLWLLVPLPISMEVPLWPLLSYEITSTQDGPGRSGVLPCPQEPERRCHLLPWWGCENFMEESHLKAGVTATSQSSQSILTLQVLGEPHEPGKLVSN